MCAHPTRSIEVQHPVPHGIKEVPSVLFLIQLGRDTRHVLAAVSLSVGGSGSPLISNSLKALSNKPLAALTSDTQPDPLNSKRSNTPSYSPVSGQNLAL